MTYKKRNTLTTIEEVVLDNVKMTKAEFFDEKKQYSIKYLDENDFLKDMVCQIQNGYFVLKQRARAKI